jgi:hypothetical protein
LSVAGHQALARAGRTAQSATENPDSGSKRRETPSNGHCSGVAPQRGENTGPRAYAQGLNGGAGQKCAQCGQGGDLQHTMYGEASAYLHRGLARLNGGSPAILRTSRRSSNVVPNTTSAPKMTLPSSRVGSSSESSRRATVGGSTGPTKPPLPTTSGRHQ